MNHPTDRFTKSEDDGELWLTAAEIGKALGYTHPAQSINYLHKQHKDEFDNHITQVVDTTIPSNLTRKIRIFNLEGIALICMFSEQPIAKKFRKWVRRVAKEVFTKGKYEEPRLIQSKQPELTTLVRTSEPPLHRPFAQDEPLHAQLLSCQEPQFL